MRRSYSCHCDGTVSGKMVWVADLPFGQIQLSFYMVAVLVHLSQSIVERLFVMGGSARSWCYPELVASKE